MQAKYKKMGRFITQNCSMWTPYLHPLQSRLTVWQPRTGIDFSVLSLLTVWCTHPTSQLCLKRWRKPGLGTRIWQDLLEKYQLGVPKSQLFVQGGHEENQAFNFNPKNAGVRSMYTVTAKGTCICQRYKTFTCVSMLIKSGISLHHQMNPPCLQ